MDNVSSGDGKADEGSEADKDKAKLVSKVMTQKSGDNSFIHKIPTFTVKDNNEEIWYVLSLQAKP